MLTRSLLVVIGVFALPIIPAFADDTFTYRTDASNYVVAPNQTVAVSLFLEETASDGTFFLDSEGGLFSAGIQGSLVPNILPISAPVVPATILQVDPDFAFNSDILTPLISNTDGTFSLLEFADLSGTNGALPVAVNANSEEVAIGVLWITAGSVPGDVTTFALSDYSTGADTLSFVSFAQVDPSSITTFTITTSSVPEPAGITILAVAAGSLVCRRKRCSIRLVG